MSPSTPSGGVQRPILYALLALFVLLHNDLWWWDDATFVLGLPIALTYHLGYCLAAMALMALMIRFAWPSVIDHDPEAAPAVESPAVEDARDGGAP